MACQSVISTVFPVDLTRVAGGFCRSPLPYDKSNAHQSPRFPTVPRLLGVPGISAGIPQHLDAWEPHDPAQISALTGRGNAWTRRLSEGIHSDRTSRQPSLGYPGIVGLTWTNRLRSGRAAGESVFRHVHASQCHFAPLPKGHHHKPRCTKSPLRRDCENAKWTGHEQNCEINWARLPPAAVETAGCARSSP